MKIVDGKPMTTRQQAKVLVGQQKYKEALKLSKAWKEDPSYSKLVRGYECMTNPRFYGTLGVSIEEAIDEAITIIKALVAKVEVA